MNAWNNEIHKALAHPIRRSILECLQNRNLSFTQLLECTHTRNHGKIGFHLRVLSELVELEPSTGKYHLTDRGKLANELIRNIQFITTKGKRGNRLIRYVTSLTLKDHAVLFYDTERFKRRILFPFLQTGLLKNQAVVYLVPEHRLDSESRGIQKFGIDLQQNEAFTIMSAEKWYLKEGRAQAKTIIKNTRKLIKKKQKAGFTGIRGAAEMQAFFDHQKTKDLLKYEQTLGRKLALNLCALCLYNTKRLNENQFTQVINSHGHLISKDIVGKTTH